jgi:hypothetical protein
MKDGSELTDEHVEKFSEIMGNHFSNKESELRHEAGDPYNEENLPIYPGEKNYIRHFLLWCKEHEVIPLMERTNGKDPVRLDATRPDDDVEIICAEIWKRVNVYRKECKRVCDQIGLKILANNPSILHGQTSECRVTIDNPCGGGHVMGKLSVPIEFIEKCLVLGIPE